MYRDLGKSIEKRAAQTGCSVVRTYCGHGIGMLFHTAPNVPHYAKNKVAASPNPLLPFDSTRCWVRTVRPRA